VKGDAARASTASDEKVKRAMLETPVDAAWSVEGDESSVLFLKFAQQTINILRLKFGANS
jgi:hypothetical protein